jgi:hypothetical protein
VRVNERRAVDAPGLDDAHAHAEPRRLGRPRGEARGDGVARPLGFTPVRDRDLEAHRLRGRDAGFPRAAYASSMLDEPACIARKRNVVCPGAPTRGTPAAVSGW